jgi:multiple antibiotic resistance protein
MEIISAATLLFLVLDPLGNIPLFLFILDKVAPERRTIVVIREVLLALAVLMLFLFLISIKMVFPVRRTSEIPDDIASL